MKIPVNVAVDEEGQIYVTDTGRGQVLIFDQNGNLLQALGPEGRNEALRFVCHQGRVFSLPI